MPYQLSAGVWNVIAKKRPGRQVCPTANDSIVIDDDWDICSIWAGSCRASNLKSGFARNLPESSYWVLEERLALIMPG